MVEFILQFFSNPVRCIVLFTFLVALFKVKLSNKTDRLLIAILTVCLTNEIVTLVLILHQLPRSLATTISITIHHILWLMLLAGKLARRVLIYRFTGFFLVFAIVNIFWLEGPHHFNYYTFVIGAFIYLAFFIAESYQRLQGEDVRFFLAIDYVLIFSPVVLFFGMSFMFGFKSQNLTSTFLMGVKLYDWIIMAVNIFYYAAINIYLFGREK